MEAIKEERELFFVCYIPDIYYSMNSIIHWIDLDIDHYSCNIVDIYKKNKENCPQTGNKLVEISFLVRSICGYFGSEETRKIENQASKFTEIK